MGKYHGYEKYKNSGVEWLGEVPEHWEVKRLRFILKEQFVNGLFKKREYWGKGNPIINVFDVYTENNIVNVFTLDRVECEEEELSKYSARHGDFFFVRSSLKLEGIGKAVTLLEPSEPIVFECHLVRGRPDFSIIAPKLLISYLNCHLTRAVLISRANQVTMATIDQSKFKDIFVPLPPLDEQKTIAQFLDHKTKQIDELIAKKEALLEKLDEKRTALINHAVTKGLDPNVPMKDSGVKWLGEIPEHWEVIKVKHLTKILRGKFTHRPRNDPKLYDGQYPFIQTGDVANANKLLMEYTQTLNENGYAVSKEFPSGTLVMTIAANIGDMAILNFNACFPDSIVGFVPSKNAELFFLYYLFSSMKKQFLSTAVLNTQLNLNVERISNIFTVIPPLDEQIKINNFLDKEMQKIDQQKAKINEAIELLKEYRTALITNAVTGKIDVRQVPIP